MTKQLAVPVSLEDDVLRSYHDCLAGAGHNGQDRTYVIMRMKYFWPIMYRDSEEYVKSYIACQKGNRHYQKKKAPLKPMPTVDVSYGHSWTPKEVKRRSHCCVTWLLFVDAGSKWCEAFPLKTMEAVEIADILYNEIICRYGAPDSIVSDRGANFMSKVIKHICNIFQITKEATSSYYPETNAACERMKSLIQQTLGK